MKTLVTGANGLVGKSLVLKLKKADHDVYQVVRKTDSPSKLVVGEINGDTDWASVLFLKPEVVVHLAAHMPVMGPTSNLWESNYRQVNTLGTLNLARQCAQHGVRRFVFLSTVKVLGEGKDVAYRNDDVALPNDAYASSKWHAEMGLMDIAFKTGLEVVILRPPLVFGPGVKMNFLNLIKAVDRGLPMPLGGISNKRSLIYVGNLVDAIRACIEHPAAAFKTYLVSDGEDLSTSELVLRLTLALGRPCRIFYIAPDLLRMAGKLLGKTQVVNRLMETLTVDSSLIQADLEWSPPFSLERGLSETIKWYRSATAK